MREPGAHRTHPSETYRGSYVAPSIHNANGEILFGIDVSGNTHQGNAKVEDAYVPDFLDEVDPDAAFDRRFYQGDKESQHLKSYDEQTWDAEEYATQQIAEARQVLEAIQGEDDEA